MLKVLVGKQLFASHPQSNWLQPVNLPGCSWLRIYFCRLRRLWWSSKCSTHCLRSPGRRAPARHPAAPLRRPGAPCFGRLPSIPTALAPSSPEYRPQPSPSLPSSSFRDPALQFRGAPFLVQSIIMLATEPTSLSTTQVCEQHTYLSLRFCHQLYNVANQGRDGALRSTECSCANVMTQGTAFTYAQIF